METVHWRLEVESLKDSLCCSTGHMNQQVKGWCDEQAPRGSCSMFMLIFIGHRHPDEGASLQGPMRAPPVLITIVSLNLCGNAFASE